MRDVTRVTLEARRERSRTVCRILSKHVGMVTPPGIGHWDPAWAMVEGPSRRFLDAIDEWERTGEEAAMDRAKALALEVRDAWREAGRLYREAEPHEEGVTA